MNPDRDTHKQPELQAPEAPVRSRRERAWEELRENRLALSGLVVFLLFFVVAVAGLALTSGSDPVLDPAKVRLQEKLRPPFSRPYAEILPPADVPTLGIYLLGTDDLGRDVFARMLQGAWVSLTVGFVAVGISVLIGIIMGGLAGYFGQQSLRVDQTLSAVIVLAGAAAAWGGSPFTGLVLVAGGLGYLIVCSPLITKRLLSGRKSPRKGISKVVFAGLVSIDTLIMRFVDIMLCFPSFFLILTVVALLPASIYNIMAVIGLTSWMGAARFVRAEFLSLREQDFVTAAHALGVSNRRIIFRHMIPNAIAPVLVSATIGIATAILTEAGLSFLGFGVPPPHATWGNILSEGKRFIFDAPWLTFAPGIAILIVVLSFNLFGEGLRDIMNPKLRER
ncbi:MAG: ABC transporter permease [Desulfobacteraceae bacterium]